MKQPFLILLILLNFGCINRQSFISTTETETTSATSADIGHPINYDNTPVLKTLFVTDREGLEARQEPDSDSEILATYEYGDPLEIIEETENYYGIRDRISRQIEEQDQTIISNGWEKIYVPKNRTGTFDQISLCAADLNIVTCAAEPIDGEMRHTFFDEPKPLDKYLTFELIDKQLYDEKRKTAVNFLTADTTAIVKTHGIFTLPCKNEPIEFADVDSEGDSYQFYTYIGRIDSLNCYVVECSYYENWAFELIDRTNGTTLSTTGYPHVSPDLKYVICIHENTYEGTADMELYAIQGDRIEQGIVFASFANWMPLTTESTETPIFWSADNYLYAAVNHSKTYWRPDNQHQYIRIKIVEP